MSLIINSPYAVPEQHWRFADAQTPPAEVPGRRSAGYTVATPGARAHNDMGRFVPLELVNRIRPQVEAWRGRGYPGITGTTKKLLEHWQDKEQRDHPFFFCQIEAIETLIWLVETDGAKNAGVVVPGDGGAFRRLCCKLATGTGKTVVMAMVIAWQGINRATDPTDSRFAKDVFIVAPNLTIRERLEVLNPKSAGNYYDEFGIVPAGLTDKLRQVTVVIRNWQALQWESEEKIRKKKGVDKRGGKSDAAYTAEVLGDIADARNLLVINDEAHHAWRVPAEAKVAGVSKEEIDEATKWIGALDRIHNTCGILNCFDFSATPFVPGGRAGEVSLFGWIVSDFGLNDAIESGLVKTPRIVVRDDAIPDAKTYKPRLYHIYNDDEVRDDLNRKADKHEPLPDLVRNAYALLGADWQQAKEKWAESRQAIPPVMITVANRTETAARIKYAFENGSIIAEDLSDKNGILHIDSVELKKAEEKELSGNAKSETDGDEIKTLSKGEKADLLREKVNTVGQAGRAGGKIQNVISVGMLSEGWDARTVTHIMGLRAFTSQLLCEQVVGRGLRRASYEVNKESGLFDAEYVNVFGVPFSFLPYDETVTDPPPPQPKTTVEAVAEKAVYEIAWPNVVRVDKILRAALTVDWAKAEKYRIDVAKTAEVAELAPTVDNKPDVSHIKEIDLERLAKKHRQQTLIFQAAQTLWEKHQNRWAGSPQWLMAELVRLAEEFITSDRIEITPNIYNTQPDKKRLIVVLNMSGVFNHFLNLIEQSNTEQLTIIPDENHPIRSTGGMRPWRTGKHCHATDKSHINFCVYDSTWEDTVSFELDKNEAVAAWVKNDHLGFEVLYVTQGVVRKYRPDFLIRLPSGEMLVLEVKGQQTEQDNAKHSAMRDWVAAVNERGDFGQWHFAVSTAPADIKDILEKFNNSKNRN